MALELTQPRAGARLPGALAVRASALAYLALMLVIPLAVIVQDGLSGGLGGLVRAVSQPVALHALWLSLWTAAIWR